MRFKFRILIYVVIVGLVIGLFPGVIIGNSKEPLKIGVMMDLTGPEDLEPELVLDWASEMVNSGGGINGCPVKLVYRDTYDKNITEVAEEFLNDDSIRIVIGPLTSDDAFELAPVFINKKKLLISPTATTASIFRAFAGKEYFWRTCQGDVAQSRTIMYLLEERNVKRFTLIYQDSAYGETYLEWLPFFAQEMDMEIVDLIPFNIDDNNAEGVVDRALAGEPEYVIVAAYAEDVVLLKEEFDSCQTSSSLFFTDAAQTSHLIEELGAAAEGIEGTAPTFNPNSGFKQAYIDKFGSNPLSYAATIWDSFLLATYTLARNEYKVGTERIEESLQTVIHGQGTLLEWNDIERGIALIGGGGHPDIEGAAGSLEFDEEYGVDPVKTYYAHWEVKNGVFHTNRVLGLAEIQEEDFEEGVSLSRVKSSTKLTTFSLLADSVDLRSGERSDLQAVIIATTMGWGNYRHQSDALAIYNLLRENGVRDENIILFLVDDIPSSEMNPLPGTVRHEAGGVNNRDGVKIDYFGDKVTAQNLLNILTGKATNNTPLVLNSSRSTDVLLYVVGHGDIGEIPFADGNPLSSEVLAETITNMYQLGRYRQMLIITELCFGASMAEYIEAPAVLYISAATEMEQSFGTNYDSEVGTWLADDFTYQTIATVSRNPWMYLTDFYTEIYGKVSGSHVQMKNHENFGDIRSIRISDFFIP